MEIAKEDLEQFKEDLTSFLIKFRGDSKVKSEKTYCFIVPTAKMKKSFFHSLRTLKNKQERLSQNNTVDLYKTYLSAFRFLSNYEHGANFVAFARIKKFSDINKKDDFASVANLMIEYFLEPLRLLSEEEEIEVDTHKGKAREFVNLIRRNSLNSLSAIQEYMNFVEEIAEVEGVNLKNILTKYCKYSGNKEELIKEIFFTNQFIAMFNDKKNEELRDLTVMALLTNATNNILMRYTDETSDIDADEKRFLKEKLGLLENSYEIFSEKYIVSFDINNPTSLGEKYKRLNSIIREDYLKDKISEIEKSNVEHVKKKL